MKSLTAHKYIECDCGCTVMKMTLDVDRLDNDKGFVYFKEIHFTHYRNGSFGLWDRIREAWRYIKTGEYYDDHLIFTLETAEEMADWIKGIRSGSVKLVEKGE